MPFAHAIAFVLVGERLHGDHRAEDLVLDHLVVLLQPGDDGRLEEEAGQVGLAPPVTTSACSGLALEEALHPLALARGVERAERRVGDIVSPRTSPWPRREAVDDVVVDAWRREHAGRGRAVLAGVVVAGAGDRLQRGLQVDVVEDDDRRLAAELEVHALERVGRRAWRSTCRSRRCRSGRPCRPRGGSTIAAPAGSPWPPTTLRTPGGRMSAASSASLQRRQRRRLGRLEHDRVAGGERRADLPDRHHQRVVPGRDLADDADRLAADERGVALDVLAGGLALQVAGGAGEEAQVVGDDRHLVARARPRSACRRRRPRGRAISSPCSSIRSASRSSARARSPGGVRAQPPRTRVARRPTARSTSACVESGAVAIARRWPG